MLCFDLNARPSPLRNCSSTHQWLKSIHAHPASRRSIRRSSRERWKSSQRSAAQPSERTHRSAGQLCKSAAKHCRVRPFATEPCLLLLDPFANDSTPAAHTAADSSPWRRQWVRRRRFRQLSEYLMINQSLNLTPTGARRAGRAAPLVTGASGPPGKPAPDQVQVATLAKLRSPARPPADALAASVSNPGRKDCQLAIG